MRSQTSLEHTTATERTTGKFDYGPDIQRQLAELERQNRERLRLHRAEQKLAEEKRAEAEGIPRSEQDEDRWKYVSPGRDPVTDERGVSVERRRG